MKKTTMNLIANVSTIAAGIVLSQLSQNENLNRRIAAMKKASADVSRQINNEKILDKHSEELRNKYKVMLLTNKYEAGKYYKMDYANFFMLYHTAYEVYDGDQKTTLRKVFKSFDGIVTDFCHTERRVINGKLYIFIPDKINTELPYSKDGDILLYRNIIANGNVKGKVWVFDMKALQKNGYDPFKYGDNLIKWPFKKSLKETKGTA